MGCHRLLLVGCVCLLVVLSAGAARSSAAVSPAPYLDDTFAAYLEAWFNMPSATGPAAIASDLGKVELASGSAVGITELGVGTLTIVTGTATTIAIGALLTYGATQLFEHWLGSSDTITAWSGATNFRWKHYVNTSSACQAATGTTASSCWLQVYGQGCSQWGDPNYYGGPNAEFSGYPEGYYSPGASCGNALFGSAGQFAKNYAGGRYGAHVTVVSESRCSYGQAGHVTCRMIWLSDTEMNRVIGLDVPPTPYTGQAHGYTYTGPSTRPGPNVPAGRTAISGAHPCLQNLINNALDPYNWAGPSADCNPIANTGDPGGVIWNMPNCHGLSVAACESAITTASTGSGNTIGFTVTTATIQTADLTIGAAQVVSTAPAVGSHGRPTTITITKNPDPLPIVWVAANWDETYDQYVTRLRNLGWLGTVTPVALAENNGDSEFIGGGVPCTSAASGSRVGATDPVTIYMNAATLGTGDPAQGMPACPGRLVTSRTSNKCTFKNNRWASVIAGNEPFYTEACDDAWAYFWANQQIFNEDGSITAFALSNSEVENIISGDELGDADVIMQLSAQDPDMTHWAKARTRVFYGSNPFEIHFYRHLPTNTVRFDVDFKIRFLQVFSP